MSTFINQLYQKMIDDIPTIFPGMGFWRNGKIWYSPYNVGGTEPTHKRKDKSYIIKSKKDDSLVWGENGDGGSKNVITAYMELNNISERWNACVEIAKIIGVEVPQNKESIEKNKKEIEQREFLYSSWERQRKALFSPEGAATLNFLRTERKYSDEFIKAKGYGYMSLDEAHTLEEKGITFGCNIAYYPFSLPYFSDGKLWTFKVRCIDDSLMDRGIITKKTSNQKDFKVKYHPYHLPSQNVSELSDKKRRLVFVEGERDCDRTEDNTDYTVIASGGGKVKKESLDIIVEKGYNSAILLYDNDKGGKSFIANSIKPLAQIGITPFVALIPAGKDKPKMDPDDYLKENTGESLRGIIDNAENGFIYLYNEKIKEYENKEDTPLNKEDLKNDVIDLVSCIKDITIQDRILAHFGAYISTNLVDLKKSVKEYVSLLVREKHLQEQKTIIKNNLSQAIRNCNDDKIEEAKKNLEQTTDDIHALDDIDKYRYLLEDDSEEIWESYRKPSKDLFSGFEVQCAEDTYNITFPAGGISVIAAPSGHGKSKMLQSSTINILQHSKEDDGCILYFTYEESKESVTKQFLNAYANLDITREDRKKHGNFRTISEYLQDGDMRFFNENTKAPFKQAEKEFKDLLATQKLKIIKPEDNYLSTLTGQLRFLTSNMKVKCVFIDYIQEVYIESTKNVRTEELKQIMIDIDLIAQNANIPIVMAAQLSRDKADSPLTLCNQFIADSTWIANKASEIVMMWSNKQNCVNDPKKDKDDKVREELNFKLGCKNGSYFNPITKKNEYEGCKIYLTITKSRNIPVGGHTIVNITPNTGRISANGKYEEETVINPDMKTDEVDLDDLPF